MGRRLFVACDLPEELTEPIATLQSAFDGAAGLTTTDPSQAHLTLKFLGDTAPDRIDAVERAIQRAVAAADVGPTEITVGGLGVFPSLEYVRVVWAGVRAGADALTALHEALERETTALGFEPESHEFTPHVTLARMNDARGKESVTDLVSERDPAVGTFTAREVCLIESVLTDEGARYETVAAVEL